jgi:predicted ribosomally synthesized peptide with SipW-like signal peptide
VSKSGAVLELAVRQQLELPATSTPQLPPAPTPAKRRPTFGLFQKVLLSMFGLGIMGSVIGHGTMASFTATSTNPGTTFTAGTLLMTNSKSTSCTQVTYGGNCGTALSLSNMSAGQSTSGTLTITNSGAAKATTMTLTTLNATTTGLGAYLNMTIHDDATNKCIYGAAGLPAAGACDVITALTSQVAQDAFTNTGPLTIPASSGSQWTANEAHTFTVTVQVANNVGVPASATATIDFQWDAAQ